MRILKLILGFGIGFCFINTTFGAIDISQTTTTTKQLTYTTQCATNGRNAYFSKDGLKLFNLCNNFVYQYTLSTAWDISTATYSNKFKDLASYTQSEINNRTLQFSYDGTKIYTIATTNGKIYQMTLTGAWDISTLQVQNKSFSWSGFTANRGQISGDGNKFFLTDTSTQKIYELALSTAWDISTATYSNKNYSFLTTIQNIPAPFFSNDGKHLFVNINTTYLKQYNLSTAWDISTITDPNKQYNLSSNQYTGGGFIPDDGTKIFLAGTYLSVGIVKQFNTNGTASPPIFESCTDGILNQNETSTDYGGACGTCSSTLSSTGGVYTPMNITYSGLYQEIISDSVYRANENNSGALGYLFTDRATKLSVQSFAYWTWNEGQYYSGSIDGYLYRLWYGNTSTGEYIQTDSAPFGMESLGSKAKIVIENFESGTTSIFNDDLFTYKPKRMGYIKLYGSSEGTYNINIQYQKWNGAKWEYKSLDSEGWKMGQVVTFYDKFYPMVNRITIELNDFDTKYLIQKIEVGKYVQNIDTLLQCKYANGEEVTQAEIQQSQNTNINGNIWDTGTGAGNTYDSNTGFLNTNDISGSGGFSFGTLTPTTSGATCEMFSGTTFLYASAGAKLTVGLNNNFRIAKDPWTCKVLGVNPCLIAYNNLENFINFAFNLNSNGIDKMLNPLNDGLKYIGSPVDGQYYCFFGKSMKYTGKVSQYTALNGQVVNVAKMTGFDYMLIFIMILSFITLWIKK